MTDTAWISLSFDDALDQHLDVALPAIDAYRLPGTFYVHLSSPTFFRRQAEWKAAAERGHELGNHTVFHPAVATKAWVRPGNAIDDYSLDRMRMELELANSYLNSLDQRTERTFAYPCSNSFVGRPGWGAAALQQLGWDRTRIAGWVQQFHLDIGSQRQSYAPLIGELFLAGRAGGLERRDDVPPVSTWDRTCLLSKAVESWSLIELQDQVTRGLSRGTWTILQFHGVGGGHHMDCDPQVFRDFVAWLAQEHPQRVITVLEGARRLWPRLPEQELTTPQAGSSTSGRTTI